MAKQKTDKMVDSKESTINVKDELTQLISKNLSKQFKEIDQVVWDLSDSTQNAPSGVIDWISTGSSLLDLAISNRPYGGIPVGRITEISGLESSGKSLIAAHILAETQKKGGIAVCIDDESAISEQFMLSIGVDLSKLMYLQLYTVEDIFQAIETIINTTRNSDKKRLLTIVVDSIAGATTKVELEANYEQKGYATQKSILLSQALRKITNLIATEKICVVFTNQLRTKMNAQAFSDNYITSGGMAVAFHSSVRLRVSRVGKLKTKDWGGVDVITGDKLETVVKKNKVGPPYRKASFEMYYNSGIDNYSGWIKVLVTYKLLKQNGAYYTYTLNTDGVDEDIKFMAKDLHLLFEKNSKLKDAMYNDLCKVMIMEYKKNGQSHIDDTEIDESGEED